MNIRSVLLTVLLAAPAYGFDLGNAVDKASKAADNPNGTLQDAGNAVGDRAMQELTKKLKSVQNEKGPIVFKTGKADLDVKKSERSLKAIDGIIKQYPGFLVQVEGHTDNKGSSKRNMDLSQKRAEAVVAWLINNLQTPANRMVAKGF